MRSLGRDDGVAHRPRQPSEPGRAARRGGLWANAQRLRIPRDRRVGPLPEHCLLQPLLPLEFRQGSLRRRRRLRGAQLVVVSDVLEELHMH